MSPATVYVHFTNLAEVFDAVLVDLLTDIRAAGEEYGNGDGARPALRWIAEHPELAVWTSDRAPAELLDGAQQALAAFFNFLPAEVQPGSKPWDRAVVLVFALTRSLVHLATDPAVDTEDLVDFVEGFVVRANVALTDPGESA